MKKIISIIALLCLTFLVFAEDEIALPDVSTVIKADKKEILDETLKEFNEVFPPEEQILPEVDMNLPELESNDIVQKNTETEQEETHYFQGKIGAGYQGFFLGDFSLSRSEKNGYFSFDFSHQAYNGYGQNKSVDGFFDNTTLLRGDGSVDFTEKFSMSFIGEYNSMQFGLQGLSPLFYSTALQQGKAFSSINFICNDYVQLAANINTNYSSWFASFVPSQTTSDVDSSINRFYLSPTILLLVDIGQNESVLQMSYQLNTTTALPIINRGIIQYSMEQRLNNFLLHGDFGVVLLQDQTVLPFSLGIDYTNGFELSVSGGLKSQQISMYDKEKDLLVMETNTTSEQSDWFGFCSVSLPVDGIMENNLSISFEKTAFENGLLLADYSKIDSSTGLFTLSEVDSTRLDSAYSMIFYLDNSQINAQWNAHWLDCPSGIAPHKIGLSYNYISEKNIWSIFTSGKILIGADSNILGDTLPILDLGFSYRPNSMFKLSLELSDIIKLVSGTNRTLYYSYTDKSGVASIFVSFYL